MPALPTPSFFNRLIAPRLGTENYRPWEWTVMRILFAGFGVYRTSPHQLDPNGTGQLFSSTDRFVDAYGQQPAPNGLAQLFDLTFVVDSPFREVAPWVFYIALALYAVGRFPAIAIGILLGMDIIYGTLANSQGAIHHTGQIVSYILLGQFGWFVFCAVRRRIIAHRDPPPPDTDRSACAAGAIFISQQMIAAAYVVSGISKLIRSEGSWVAQIPNIALQFEKNIAMRYYETLEMPPEAANRGAIALIENYPLAAQTLFGFGLILELFAFLALWNRWTLALWGIGLWLLHSIVSQIMQLGFAHNKTALLIFFINVPFWIAAAISSRRQQPRV